MHHNRNHSFRLVGLCLSLALAYLVGCGGKPAKVSGIVTVDGKPLEQGTVAFSPADRGMRASGIIQSDGSYVIRTNRDSGLEIGEYEVAVASRELLFPGGPDYPPMPGKYLAPKRYGRTQTSGLRFNVEKGSNTIDIDLSSEGAEADSKGRRGRR